MHREDFLQGMQTVFVLGRIKIEYVLPLKKYPTYSQASLPEPYSYSASLLHSHSRRFLSG